jgi:hypothetical protein
MSSAWFDSLLGYGRMIKLCDACDRCHLLPAHRIGLASLHRSLTDLADDEALHE